MNMKTNAAQHPFSRDTLLQRAHETLTIEAAALHDAATRLDDAFVRAVELILNLAPHARVVVLGIGKSGHVGRKLAATLASTGTPAFFVHPAEAGHGDLGMIQAGDAVLAISNSGENAELNLILPIIKRLGVPLIALTGHPQSTLAQYADVVLNSEVEKEACPLNLAPTASTTVQMALGDALAIALLEARGFKTEDFARSHPGGALGRKLLTHVKDVMRKGEAVPKVAPDTDFAALMVEMSHKGLGAAAIVDAQDHPIGIFTDGDLRRLIQTGRDLRSLTAGEVMHSAPRTVKAQALAAEAAQHMENLKINVLLVTGEDDRLIGAISSNDLMRARVI